MVFGNHAVLAGSKQREGADDSGLTATDEMDIEFADGASAAWDVAFGEDRTGAIRGRKGKKKVESGWLSADNYNHERCEA